MSRRPAGKFMWPPRHLPARDVADPSAFDCHLAEHADLVAGARSKADEPEMIGRAILSTYGKDALYFQSLRYAAAVEAGRQARALLAAEDRLRDAQRRAKAQHRGDLRGEFRAIDEMLKRAARGGRSTPLRAVERLESVEASLDRPPGLDRAA
jgi:hypothetical protein